ncbi:calcineurin-like phosphoesterase family protein [Mucilaginibacter yixingensis]|uniref:Calcineurin-like phosphoesterase family protein n=1 Tax=Mucilaginibacter yixingensis TaxID=1295612 RepID=A0A2T5J4A9_9SPHI|nr:metallophosphoesterase [Mucilaginibacter yixingensis]PTQ92012.1 calcineurin-like phosphoesterase family protein [Mucilaginibacter yixingensis]
MSAKVIIHLSDLHVSSHKNEDEELITKPGSYLTTSEANNIGKNFIDEFCAHVQTHYGADEKYLIISGDIADKSYEPEYHFAVYFLKRLTDKLGIPSEKIMVVPGDHDVNRMKLTNAYAASDKRQKPYELHEAKFADFSAFYQSFLERDFAYDSIITDTLVFTEERLLLIGLNSNGHIGIVGGKGFIDQDQLDAELTALLTEYTDFVKIAVFHHNFYGQYENNLDGQWDAHNKIEVKRVLERHGFGVVMYGNEHTSASNSVNQLAMIAAPAFSKTDVPGGFKVYRIDTESGLFLDHFIHGLRNEHAHTDFPFGSWSKLQKNDNNENIGRIVLRQPVAAEIVIETHDLLAMPRPGTEAGPGAEDGATEMVAPEADGGAGSLVFDFNKNEYHKKLFGIVKELNLFKSGHFHWSDSSKAHNWIDVPMLLSERDHVMLAQKAIYDVVTRNELDFDFVLALGIEGNIIGSYTGLRSDKPFSYLPYSYRYNDHEAYEKKIAVENGGRFRHILIITDVVNNGKTVDRLVENEQEFFKPEHIDRISVVSLFYTGSTPDNIVSNASNLRVDHYFVSHMKVERCPYGKDFRETCMIYREKLACVHEFYDASQT